MTKLISDNEIDDITELYKNTVYPEWDVIQSLLVDRALLMAVAKAAEWANRQASNDHAWDALASALRAAGLIGDERD